MLTQDVDIMNSQTAACLCLASGSVNGNSERAKSQKKLVLAKAKVFLLFVHENLAQTELLVLRFKAGLASRQTMGALY